MRQQELFGADLLGAAPAVEVPGFRLIADYITPAEEQQLLAAIDAQPWEGEYKRRIQQYGLGYAGQRGGRPMWVRDFPEWLIALAKRVEADAPMPRFPENCVINEYIPPQGIGPHVDYPDFGPTVACVSLGSDIVMDLRKAEQQTRVSIVVPARSLWVLTGEARSHWEHGIGGRLSDVINGVRVPRSRRVSVTFRTAAKQ